jgi:hypothetical protein
MPKIFSTYIIVESVRIEIDVHYTHGKGFYAKKIPDSVLKFCNCTFSGFDTEGELLEHIRISLINYHESIKNIKKVIIYSLQMSTDVYMNKENRGSWHGYKPWVDHEKFIEYNRCLTSSINGYGFSIIWDVLYQVKSKDTKYYVIDNNGSIGFESRIHEASWEIIDWTVEREQAFIDIDKSIEELVKKISLFLGNSEKLCLAIDNNSLPLISWNK